MASVGALSISGHQFVHRFEAIECSFLIILSDAFSDKPNKSYSLQKVKMTICRAKYAAQGILVPTSATINNLIYLLIVQSMVQKTVPEASQRFPPSWSFSRVGNIHQTFINIESEFFCCSAQSEAILRKDNEPTNATLPAQIEGS